MCHVALLREGLLPPLLAEDLRYTQWPLLSILPQCGNGPRGESPLHLDVDVVVISDVGIFIYIARR